MNINFEDLRRIHDESNFLDLVPEGREDEILEYATQNTNIKGAVAAVVHDSQDITQTEAALQVGVSEPALRSGRKELGLRQNELDYDFPEKHRPFVEAALRSREAWTEEPFIVASKILEEGAELKNKVREHEVKEKSVENHVDRLDIYQKVGDTFDDTPEKFLNELAHLSGYQRISFQTELLYGDKVHREEDLARLDIERTMFGNVAGKGGSVHEALRTGKQKGYSYEEVDETIENLGEHVTDYESTMRAYELAERLEKGYDLKEASEGIKNSKLF